MFTRQNHQKTSLLLQVRLTSSIRSMFSITTITQPSLDTQHPLLLLQSSHGEKYMFGKIAEGAQRALTENKIKISKLENIFLTGELDWSSLGGLPGMILTIADQGKDKLVLNYGTELIKYVVSTWRYFVFRFGISLDTNVSGQYKDKLITVNTINIKSTVKNSNQTIKKSIFGEKEQKLLNSIVSNMFPKLTPTHKYEPSSDPHLNVNLPSIDNVEHESTCYEICFNPIRGKFRVDEAIKLGVPKGPLFAKLSRGEDVTLDDGTIIKPEQVLEKERTFGKVLIVDIPNDSYLDSMILYFDKYDTNDLRCIYYFLGNDVTINDKLITFMELFNKDQGNKIKHVVSHSLISPNNISFMGSAITTLKLKALQNSAYNLPITNQVLSKEFFECFDKETPEGVSLIQSQENAIKKSSLKSDDVYILSQDTTVQLEPYTKGIETDPCKISENNRRNIDKQFPWKKLFTNHIEPLDLQNVSYKRLIEDQLNVNNFNNKLEKREHVEIITLGTGSALPSKYRNVVSTLLKVPFKDVHGNVTNRNILFDAGENTLGTIRRMFSNFDIGTLFKDLKLIYLSHLHADHHLGIVSVLKEWYIRNKEDQNAIIYLITPWQYNKFINEWMRLESPEILSRIKYISCEHLIKDKYVRMETQAISISEYETFTQGSTTISNKNNTNISRNNKKKRKLSLNQNSSYRDLETINAMYKDLHIYRYETCRAIHCNWAYSNTITFNTNEVTKKPFRVSYSGDTRPNLKKFAEDIGYGSDLLIHEATLDNGLQEDAIKKRHCTINEAIEVSNAMNCEKLILTHFSQRYPKSPSIDGNIKIKAREYCFAFDGMIIDWENLGEQMSILPYLSKVFAEDAQREEEEEIVEDLK